MKLSHGATCVRFRNLCRARGGRKVPPYVAGTATQLHDNSFLPFGLRPQPAAVEPLGESEMYRHEVDRARANDSARIASLCATLVNCRAAWTAPAALTTSVPPVTNDSGGVVAGGMPFASYEDRMSKVLRAHAEKKRIEAEEEKKAQLRARKSIKRPSDTRKKSTT
jgi:hypothetical protein